MIFNIISIFPQSFNSYFQESIIKKAQEKGLIKINIYDLRDFSLDKHRSVDDTVYGGGAGMLLKIEPLYRALKKIAPRRSKKHKIILLSAQGKKWQQNLAQEYSCLKEITLICGRYEGADARIENFIDEEISLGDYVLTGGELGAMVILDSISRLKPEVLGNPESLKDESHNLSGILEYPQYTKPRVFQAGSKKYSVPEVLLSGNHSLIEKWKKEQSRKIKKNKK